MLHPPDENDLFTSFSRLASLEHPREISELPAEWYTKGCRSFFERVMVFRLSWCPNRSVEEEGRKLEQLCDLVENTPVMHTLRLTASGVNLSAAMEEVANATRFFDLDMLSAAIDQLGVGGDVGSDVLGAGSGAGSSGDGSENGSSDGSRLTHLFLDCSNVFLRMDSTLEHFRSLKNHPSIRHVYLRLEDCELEWLPSLPPHTRPAHWDEEATDVGTNLNLLGRARKLPRGQLRKVHSSALAHWGHFAMRAQEMAGDEITLHLQPSAGPSDQRELRTETKEWYGSECERLELPALHLEETMACDAEWERRKRMFT
jgi:hypothetical protein